MSTIKVDTITDEAGTGAPDFPNGMTGDGSQLTGIAGAAESIAAYATAPSVGAEGSIYYNTTSDALYISDGSSWKEISPQPPITTGGTVTLTTLASEASSFSYALGTDFNDGVTSDANLIYTLTSGTLPVGVSISGVNLVWDGSQPSNNTTYTFSITATDEDGKSAAQGYSQLQESPPSNSVTGSQLFTSASGTSGTWTVPAGVLSISVVAVGAGASGGVYDNGGGGGALGYKNNITVVAGQTFTYSTGGEKANSTGNGAASTFSGAGVNLVAGGGTWSSRTNNYGVHAGGTHSGSDGGGNGGNGGVGNNHTAGPRYSAGGGGGAGGYSGNGGNGGGGFYSSASAGTSGSGGGGGGGGGGYDTNNNGYVYASAGGGVGVNGQGSSGSGGNASGDGSPTGGNPNSTAGGNGSDLSSGSYGRGGGHSFTGQGAGGQGAIRIVWHVGSTQAFPSTNVN